MGNCSLALTERQWNAREEETDDSEEGRFPPPWPREPGRSLLKIRGATPLAGPAPEAPAWNNALYPMLRLG
jgi:hypothetical protein